MRHKKISGKPAPSDSTLVGGPNWDEPHVIVGRSVTADTTLLASDDLILATGGNAGISITPLPGAVDGIVVTIMKVDAGPGAVTVLGTINGATNFVLTSRWQCVQIKAEASAGGWIVMTGSGSASGAVLINPGADQTIVGPNALKLNGGSIVTEGADTSVTSPSFFGQGVFVDDASETNELSFRVDGSGRGVVSMNGAARAIFFPNGLIALTPIANGVEGTDGVTITNSGLYLAGRFADGYALLLGSGNLGIAGAGGSTPQIAIGATGVEGIIASVPSVGAGSYKIHSARPIGDAAVSVNWPISSGTMLAQPDAGFPVFANNAAAISGGLVANQLYRTGANPDVVCVVH